MAEDAGSRQQETVGQRLIASYRAERLSRRTTFREGLHGVRESLRAERQARLGGARVAPPHPAPVPPQPAIPENVAAPEGSVFARLVAAEKIVASDPCAADAETPPGDPPAGATMLVVPASQEPVGQKPAFREPVSEEPALRELPSQEPVEPEAAAPNPAEERVAPPEPAAPERLTALGFGPGMEIRFRQVGITCVADLAAAEAAALREALGDVGTLINVDAWIAQARARPATRA